MGCRGVGIAPAPDVSFRANFEFMFHPIFHSVPFYVAFLALAAVGVLWFAPKKDGKRRWRYALARLAVLAILAWILARPTLKITETETFPGTVLILADTSRSMQITDGEKNVSRFNEMRTSLARSEAELKKMSSEVNVRAWTFDQNLHALPTDNGALILPDVPNGNQTAMGCALSDALQQSAGQKILGIVLLSDGAQRAAAPRDILPQTVAGRLQRLRVPLYTVCFGSSKEENRTIDVAVEDFLVEQRVFVNTELTASGRIRLDGAANRPVRVELLVEEGKGATPQVVAQTTLQTDKNSDALPVLLSWTPTRVGEVKVSLRVVELPNEISTANNVLGAFVNVVEGGISVLYLEGAFRPEMSFLRRALESEPEIRLDVVRLDSRKPETRKFSLTNALEKGKYEVILLGDVNSASFRRGELAALAENVAAGTGLMTLGGFQNYGPGGYAESPLAELLPVRMNRLERRLPTDSIPQNAHWNVPLRMSPTPAGQRHFALQLDKNEAASARIWANFPRLDGANRFPEGLKPGAVVLAAGVPDSKKAMENEIPLLLEQNFGQGRVLTFAGDSTWRWWMAGFEPEFKRFWCQSVLWLAKKEENLEGNVAILMTQRRFTQDQKVRFHVTAKLSSGENLVTETRSATGDTSPDWSGWRAELETPDGSRKFLRLTPGTDSLLGEVENQLTPGDYTLYASVTHAGQKIGDAQCRFMVYHHDWEMDSVQSEAQLLAALANVTGGRSVKPSQLQDLWKELAESREDMKIERETYAAVWDRWPWMLLILGMLCVEWFFRKRDGFV